MKKERRQLIWRMLLENKELNSLDPPATEDESKFYSEMSRLMLIEQKESVYQKRTSLIYQLAINNQDVSVLEPPISQAEQKLYDEIVSKTAQAKKEGQTIIWEIPFDI